MYFFFNKTNPNFAFVFVCSHLLLPICYSVFATEEMIDGVTLEVSLMSRKRERRIWYSVFFTPWSLISRTNRFKLFGYVPRNSNRGEKVSVAHKMCLLEGIRWPFKHKITQRIREISSLPAQEGSYTFQWHTLAAFVNPADESKK